MNATTHRTATTVELGGYSRTVRRHLRTSCVLGTVGLVAGLLFTGHADQTYQATAGVFVPATPTYLTLDAEPFPEVPPYVPKEWTQDTEAALLRSDAVLRRVARRLSGRWTPAEVAERIDVSVPTSTRVFVIGFTAGTPAQARDGARAAAEEFVSRRGTLLAGRADRVSTALRSRRASLQALLTDAPSEVDITEDDPVGPSALPVDRALRGTLRAQISRLDEALLNAAGTRSNAAEIVKKPVLPSEPLRSNAEVPPISGLMAGLLAGLGLGTFRDRRQQRVDDADQVAGATGLPVVARLDAGRLEAHGGADVELRELARHVRSELAARRGATERYGPLRRTGGGQRREQCVLVTGYAAEPVVESVADHLREALGVGTGTGADTAERTRPGAEAADDAGSAVAALTLATGRAGSAATLQRARTADVVVLVAALGQSTRRDLARTSRLLGARNPTSRSPTSRSPTSRSPAVLSTTVDGAAPPAPPGLTGRVDRPSRGGPENLPDPVLHPAPPVATPPVATRPAAPATTPPVPSAPPAPRGDTEP